MKLCTIYILAMAALAADTNWPQFRGPSASGVGTGSPPIEWNGRVREERPLEDRHPRPGSLRARSSGATASFSRAPSPQPARRPSRSGCYGDVTSVKGEPAQSFKVFCLDRRSGKILWERTAASGRPKVMRHPKSTHANPTPATDGKHLVVFFGSEGSLQLRPEWRAALEEGFRSVGFRLLHGARRAVGICQFARNLRKHGHHSGGRAEELVSRGVRSRQRKGTLAHAAKRCADIWHSDGDAVHGSRRRGVAGRGERMEAHRRLRSEDRQGIMEAKGRRRHPGSDACFRERTSGDHERARAGAAHLCHPRRRSGRHHGDPCRHCLDAGAGRELHADSARSTAVWATSATTTAC